MGPVPIIIGAALAVGGVFELRRRALQKKQASIKADAKLVSPSGNAVLPKNSNAVPMASSAAADQAELDRIAAEAAQEASEQMSRNQQSVFEDQEGLGSGPIIDTSSGFVQDTFSDPSSGDPGLPAGTVVEDDSFDNALASANPIGDAITSVFNGEIFRRGGKKRRRR